PLPPSADQPHVVTDLTSLSSDSVDTYKPRNATPAAKLYAKAGDPNEAHVYQEAPGLSKQIGGDKDPATARLLNDKAAKYANFSEALMERIFAQLRALEKEDQIAGHRVPSTIKPTVVTAIMDPDGTLKELILEQHSGKAALDKMVLQACKKGLWF